MRYKSISKECVDRLSEQGYSLSDGDRSYIDEVTMIVLSADPAEDCTNQEIVQRILTLAKHHLKPVPHEEEPREAGSMEEAGIASPGLWESVIQFITSRKEGPKE